MSDIIDLKNVDISTLQLKTVEDEKKPPDSGTVENYGNGFTVENYGNGFIVNEETTTVTISSGIEDLTLIEPVVIPERAPVKTKSDKAYDYIKYIFWFVLAAFIAIASTQLVFHLPHPKTWHIGFLGSSRGIDELVVIPPVEEKSTKVIEVDRFLVAIQYPDGTIEKRTGGSLSWRMNNPGRLRYSKFSIDRGAIGSAGDYAVFPTYKEGREANESLLFKTLTYRKLSILEAVKKYTENHKSYNQYAKIVVKAMKVPISSKMGDLNELQRQIFLDQIEVLETFAIGRVWKYKNIEEYQRLG